MRKMLEDQTGFTRKKAQDARRRRMDSQVRRTQRRAVRRRKRYLQSPYYQAVQMAKAIDWKQFVKTMNELGITMMHWQKHIVRTLLANPEFRRVVYSYPMRSGKTQAQKFFEQYTERKPHETTHNLEPSRVVAQGAASPDSGML